MADVRAHAIVSGRVQGIGFRMSADAVARRAGLTGWVRNLRDGRVEALLEGERAAVERVVEWLRQGPPGARVENVDVMWTDATGEFESFRVERTPIY